MKLFDDLKYYFVTVPKDYYNEICWFFRNLKFFWKTLWEYRSWDYSYCIDLFANSLERLGKSIEEGSEERRSAIKKVNAINELVMLLRHTIDDTDYNLYNDDHLEITNVKKYDAEYRKRREIVFKRIYEIIHGQSLKGIDMSNYDEWVEKFDGTGIEGWWD